MTEEKSLYVDDVSNGNLKYFQASDNPYDIYAVTKDLTGEDRISFTSPKPVLEDLLVDNAQLQLSQSRYAEELKSLWDETSDILKGFQECVSQRFGGAVIKLDEIQSVLGKLVLKTISTKTGSSLIPRFLKASRSQDYQGSREVFSDFSVQAERFAKVVITEVHESPESRLVPNAHIGGVAGGAKYIGG
jgi:hypothetical protein